LTVWERKMAITIDKEKNIAYIKMSGKITPNEFIDKYSEIIESNEYEMSMNRIWDLRDTELHQIENVEIHRVAEETKKIGGKINKVKVALVVGTDVNYGMSRMFAAYAQNNAHRDIQVFRSMEEAEGWILR